MRLNCEDIVLHERISFETFGDLIGAVNRKNYGAASEPVIAERSGGNQCAFIELRAEVADVVGLHFGKALLRYLFDFFGRGAGVQKNPSERLFG